MSGNKLQKIAIFGASGNVGASVLKHLLAINKEVAITIVTRKDSEAVFPSSSQITVKKGSYDDPTFLQSALEGNELALLTLSFTGSSIQTKLIDAAAKAGVKWIVPNEYGCDGENEPMCNAIPLMQPKIAARKQIESLNLKWIGVATNPWIELSLNAGMYGFDVPNRKATFWSGTGSWSTSSQEQVGRGIARLLSLPVRSSSGNERGTLAHYANRFAYISSALISQQSLFDAVKRATKTSDADWQIVRTSNEERMRIANERFAAGDIMGGADLMYAYYMGEGLGGNFEQKAQEDREVLGLQEENLDEMVKGTLAGGSAVASIS